MLKDNIQLVVFQFSWAVPTITWTKRIMSYRSRC